MLPYMIAAREIYTIYFMVSFEVLFRTIYSSRKTVETFIYVFALYILTYFLPLIQRLFGSLIVFKRMTRINSKLSGCGAPFIERTTFALGDSNKSGTCV